MNTYTPPVLDVGDSLEITEGELGTLEEINALNWPEEVQEAWIPHDEELEWMRDTS